MENIVLEDSPLAAYLEGRGEADSASEDAEDFAQHDRYETHNQHELNDKHGHASLLLEKALSFAPRPLTNFISTLPRARVQLHNTSSNNSHSAHSITSRLRSAYALAVTSTLGNADNERFLEHFRYILIASQLLNEHIGASAHQKSETDRYSPFPRDGDSGHGQVLSSTSLTGALVSAGAAFLLVWLLHWTRGGRHESVASAIGGLRKRRIALAVVVLAAATVILYAYVRRQWLKYLRRQAVETASAFVQSVQSFEASTSSVITLIQEIELVSRGYRISQPLPPVSRLEGRGQSRRCVRLRRHLQTVYATTIPAFMAATENLGPVRDQDDFERFLDVYDIQSTDIQEAAEGYTELAPEEAESLRQIRVHQYRLSTLRRILFCSLLSVPATGRKYDAVRWRAVIGELERLRSTLDGLAANIAKVLSEEEKLPLTITNPNSGGIDKLSGILGSASSHTGANKDSPNGTSPAAPTQSQVRLNSQLFRLNSLTSSIRSLQAKLYLLREDSARGLASSTCEADVAQVAAAFREQYGAIGADLTELVQVWQAGQTALKDDARRLSISSSTASAVGADNSGGARRSSSSLGGLTVVDEDAALLTVNTNGSGVVNDSGGPLSPRSAALYALSGGKDLASASAPVPRCSPGAAEDGAANGSSHSPYSPTAASRRKRFTVDGALGLGLVSPGEVFEAVATPPTRARSVLSREARIAKMHEERDRVAAVKDRRDANTSMLKELRAVINLRPEGVRRRSSAASASLAAPTPVPVPVPASPASVSPAASPAAAWAGSSPIHTGASSGALPETSTEASSETCAGAEAARAGGGAGG